MKPDQILQEIIELHEIYKKNKEIDEVIVQAHDMRLTLAKVQGFSRLSDTFREAESIYVDLLEDLKSNEKSSGYDIPTYY